MSITGDFAKLARLIQRLVNTRSLQNKLFQHGAVESRRLARQTFAQQTDPYGKPWKPLALRNGRALMDTGSLSSFSASVTSDGWILTSGRGWPKTHQFGATIHPRKGKYLKFQSGGKWYTVKSVTIPARKMAPDGNRGLGNWAAPLAARLADVSIMFWSL